MKAHHKLIDNLIADLRVQKIEVQDDEYVEHFNRPFQRQSILDEINSVELCNVNILDKDNEYIGYFLIVPYGVDDDETIADYSAVEFMDQHWKLLETQGVV